MNSAFVKMILRLTNFRTHKKSEYSLGEKGITLISGPSGVGKSSLLMAIQYALFGKLKRVVSIGEKKCEVELIFPSSFFIGAASETRISRIVRRSNPHLLKVFGAPKPTPPTPAWIEGVEAQEKINLLFGENFDVTGYIAQDPDKSFMLKRPSDKFDFLEAFAFKDSNIYKIKKYAKDLVAQRNNELVAAQALARDAAAVFKSLEAPAEIPFPKKCSVGNHPIVEKNARIRAETARKNIASKTKHVQRLREHESEVAILEAQMKAAEENHERVQSAHEKTLGELDAANFIGDSELERMEQELEALKSDAMNGELRAKLERDVASLASLQKCEKERLEAERDEMKAVLWSEMSRPEVVDMIEEFKEILADKKRMRDLRQSERECDALAAKTEANLRKVYSKQGDICDADIEEEIESLNQRLMLLREQIKNYTKVYSCPACSAKLRVQNDSLVAAAAPALPKAGCCVSDEELVDDIKKAEQEVEREAVRLAHLRRAMAEKKTAAQRISLVQADIQIFVCKYAEKDFQLENCENNLEEDMATSEEYLREHDGIQTRLAGVESALKEEKYSASFVKLRREVQALQKRVENLPPPRTRGGGEDAIRVATEEVAEQRSRRAIKRSAEEREIKERVQLQKSGSRLEELEVKRASLEKKSVELAAGGSIAEILEEIAGSEQALSDNEELLRKIGLFHANRIEIQEYEKQREKMETRSRDVDKALISWTISKTLQSKIKDAEYLALHNVVCAINSHAEWYLDRFFTEDGISVVLKTSRESAVGASSKSAIDVEIHYKGVEIDLEMLSGGERARVMLAYTLALGELFAVPMLMLDECTASLDQETTSLVVEAVRESYFATKLILVVAHQCVSGIFDVEVCI
jgi:exonuclease SbcC